MSEPAGHHFANDRDWKRAAGKTLFQIWVPDLNAPEARAALAREMAILRNAPEQAEATAFLEAVDAEDGWPE